MKKYFIYVVEGTEFDDTEAFGQAWKNAKALATELHAPIYRYDITETWDGKEKIEERVYLKAGILLPTNRANPEDIKVF